MESVSYTNFEAEILSLINEGYNTFDKLKEKITFNEKTLQSNLENLIAKGMLAFNISLKQYEYTKPIEGGKMILNGNIMLPMTVIRKKDKTLVCRGNWYIFPPDFDIRRIIWNVSLPGKNSSTLVDLIKDSVLKTRKSKIETLPQYKNLVKKIVPYSKKLGLYINAVGEELADVSIMFYHTFDEFIQFRDFRVKTYISRVELIHELEKPLNEKNYQNITLNRIFNFSDFVFSENCIPYEYISDSKELKYVQITGVKKRLELSYFIMTANGNMEKFDTESFESISEGIQKLKELFSGYAQTLLNENDFLCELTD